MNNIRYLVKMKNGDYMKQEWDGSLERVMLHSVDNPIDADKFRNKFAPERILKEVLSGDTAILTLYHEENPPEKVVKMEFDYKLIITSEKEWCYVYSIN